MQTLLNHHLPLSDEAKTILQIILWDAEELTYQRDLEQIGYKELRNIILHSLTVVINNNAQLKLTIAERKTMVRLLVKLNNIPETNTSNLQ